MAKRSKTPGPKARPPANLVTVGAVEQNGAVRISLKFGDEEFLMPEDSAAVLGQRLVNVVMSARQLRGETGNVLRVSGSPSDYAYCIDCMKPGHIRCGGKP